MDVRKLVYHNVFEGVNNWRSHFLEGIWQFLLESKMCIPWGPANSTLGSYPKPIFNTWAQTDVQRHSLAASWQEEKKTRSYRNVNKRQNGYINRGRTVYENLVSLFRITYTYRCEKMAKTRCQIYTREQQNNAGGWEPMEFQHMYTLCPCRDNYACNYMGRRQGGISGQLPLQTVEMHYLLVEEAGVEGECGRQTQRLYSAFSFISWNHFRENITITW